MKNSALIAMFAILMSGCSTIQTSTNTAQIPPERLLISQEKSEANSAEITLVRDRSIAGSTCYYSVLIDDKLAARIGVSEKAIFNVQPGERVLKITRDKQGDGLCASGDDMTEKKFMLNSNDKVTVQLTMNIAGEPNLKDLK